MRVLPLARNLPIRLKLMLISMATSISVLVLAASAFSVYDHFRAQRSLVHDISALARLIADRSTAALAFDDPGLATENLASLRGITSVRAAGIFDANGSLIARYGAVDGPAIQLPPNLTRNPTASRAGICVVFEEILLEGRPVGTVYIQASLEELRSRSRQFLLSAAAILCLAGLVAYFLSSRLQRIVSGPISQLAGTARLIASGQDYSLRATSARDNDLDVLVDAFNAMLAQIEERDRALQESNERLESQVSGSNRRAGRWPRNAPSPPTA